MTPAPMYCGGNIAGGAVAMLTGTGAGPNMRGGEGIPVVDTEGKTNKKKKKMKMDIKSKH